MHGLISQSAVLKQIFAAIFRIYNYSKCRTTVLKSLLIYYYSLLYDRSDPDSSAFELIYLSILD